MAPLVVAREQRHLARALRTDATGALIRTGQCTPARRRTGRLMSVRHPGSGHNPLHLHGLRRRRSRERWRSRDSTPVPVPRWSSRCARPDKAACAAAATTRMSPGPMARNGRTTVWPCSRTSRKRPTWLFRRRTSAQAPDPRCRARECGHTRRKNLRRLCGWTFLVSPRGVQR